MFDLIKIEKKYVGSDKKTHTDIQFYLVVNGNRVRVMPYFFESKDGTKKFNTFKELNMVARLVVDEE